MQEKAKLFSEHFSSQRKLILHDSILPVFKYFTDKIINSVTVNDKEITSLIRNLNPNKASGSDGISGKMLLTCDDVVVLPLKIIYNIFLVPPFAPICGK